MNEKIQLFHLLFLVIFLSELLLNLPKVYSAIELNTSGNEAIISNGIFTLNISSDGSAHSLVYKGKELIGNGTGFYASMNGEGRYRDASLKVVTNSSSIVDVAYISNWGELHYVVQSDISGIYSYFVATGIGTVGVFRTLYRVDGDIFRNGFAAERSGAFPTLRY